MKNQNFVAGKHSENSLGNLDSGRGKNLWVSNVHVIKPAVCASIAFNIDFGKRVKNYDLSSRFTSTTGC